MKKITLLFAGFALVFGSFAQNEVAPNLIKTTSNYDKAIWDIQLDADPVPIAAGLAGVIWTGTEFWVAEWAANTIHTANAAGTSTGSFTIAGVTGTRSMTTDGSSIYIGTAGTSIYQINPATKTLTSTIATSVPSCRYLTYDPTLNAGAGGFWTGAYGSNMVGVSMAGATVSTINSATHGLTGIYGLAYDPYSAGGPYLWAFDQGGNGADIVQLSMSGVPTGITHDATLDLSAAGIAGGMFICNNYVAGKNSMIGISQGASLFSYELSDPLAVDVELSFLTIAPYGLAGNLSITGQIKNVGLSTITSVDIAWDNGGPVNNQTFGSLNIAPGGTYNFNHGTPLAVTAGNCDNINATVTLVGDLDANNDDAAATHCGLSAIPMKNTVGEEKTGTWCGWCPRGAVGLANMEATSNFIGIAVHNGSNDPMRVTAYDSGIQAYVPGGYPTGGVDRVEVGNPSAAGFASMHAARASTLVPCDVKNIVANLNTSTNMIEVSADSEWYGNITGTFRLSCVITEEDVIPTSGQLNQVNYYSGGGNGSMAFPAGINNAYDFGSVSAPDPVAPSLFLGYDHTSRSLSSNAILGDVGSLPTNPTMGVHSYSFANVSGALVTNIAKGHAVVMVVDVATGEILNAAKATIGTINGVNDLDAAQFNMNIYPNPTSSVSTVSFTLSESTSVTMEVYNTMGALVYSNGTETMSAGIQKLNFDGTELPNGIYFVNLTIGNQLITKKVSINK